MKIDEVNLEINRLINKKININSIAKNGKLCKSAKKEIKEINNTIISLHAVRIIGEEFNDFSNI